MIISSGIMCLDMYTVLSTRYMYSYLGLKDKTPQAFLKQGCSNP